MCNFIQKTSVNMKRSPNQIRQEYYPQLFPTIEKDKVTCSRLFNKHYTFGAKVDFPLAKSTSANFRGESILH